MKFEEELKVSFSLYSLISEIKKRIYKYRGMNVTHSLTFRFTMTNADVLNLGATIIEATPSSLSRDTTALKHPTNSAADLVKMRHEQLRTGGTKAGTNGRSDTQL